MTYPGAGGIGLESRQRTRGRLQATWRVCKQWRTTRNAKIGKGGFGAPIANGFPTYKVHGCRSAILCRRRRSAGVWRREGGLRRSRRRRLRLGGIPDLQGATVVGRQSFADEPVGPTAPSGRAASELQSQTAWPGAPATPFPKTPFAIGRGRLKARLRLGRDSRPTRECPYNRYENALSTFRGALRHRQPAGQPRQSSQSVEIPQIFAECT